MNQLAYEKEQVNSVTAHKKSHEHHSAHLESSVNSFEYIFSLKKAKKL